MSEEAKGRCPCCGAQLDYFPDQDGSCDYQCVNCGWREHIPSSDDIAAALTLHKESHPGGKPAIEPQMPPGEKVDLKLLEEQAAILGKVVDGTVLSEDERSCLEGLWEFVHTMLDGLQAHGDKPHAPTVVLFVEGGAVQGVEGNGLVRVILCDFDCTDAPGTVGGRPCHIGVWDSPEEPSGEFNEILEVLAWNGESAAPEGEQERKMEGR